VPQSDVVVFPVQHASAVELATTITRLLNDGASTGDSSQRVNVIADERTNALLVRSDNPSRINAVRLLVNTLDRAGTNGNIHVVHLKNADATKLAQTLHAMLTGQGATPGATSSAPLSSAPTGGINRPAGSTAAGGASGIIQADATTNSLIITAPEAVYNNIRRVIDMLDRRRAQVYIEALIAEVSADRFAEFGIQWQSAKSGLSGNGATAFGGTNFGSGGRNILGLSANPASAAPGLNLAVGNGTITLPGTTTPILNLTTLARFLETQTDTNILSTPNLVMLDNEEAKIVVGQNLPFITGSFTNTGGSSVANPFQTISRQDVGLTLRIKPQISEGGAVHLQIYEESSSVVATTTNNASGPITNKRSIETTALVDDGAIIALGGLVEDSYSAGVDKVPLLGDLPLLGSLFRYDTRQRKKTNLIVFIRPKILRDAESYRALTNDRYDYVIGQQRNVNSTDRLMINEPPAPQLPQASATPAALGNDQTTPPAISK
jgi:general secretion pathway protein D